MAFMNQLNLAHQDCGNKGFVTLEKLAVHFNTPAWNELRKINSKFSTFLTTSFKHDSGNVDYEFLVCMALLHCEDKRKPTTKAEAFYCLLQDGGADKQAFISS